MGTCSSLVLLGWAGLFGGFRDGAQHNQQVPSKSVARSSRPNQGVIRLAKSRDGVHFSEVDDVLLRDASSPSIIRLPGGQLLALVDYVPDSDKKRHSVMAITKSVDMGRSWSPLRRIVIRDENGRSLRGRAGDLVYRSSRPLRLYFSEASSPKSQNRGTSRFFGATSRNGITFRANRQPLLTIESSVPFNNCAYIVRGKTHLLAGTHDPMALAQQKRGGLHHAISRNGWRFAKLPEIKMPVPCAISSVVRVRDGYRAYATTADGIVSLISRKGRSWKFERDGTSIPSGREPSVTRLSNGTYLMLYTKDVESAAQGATSSQLVEANQFGAFDDMTGDVDFLELGEDEFAEATGADGEFEQGDLATNDESSNNESVGSDVDDSSSQVTDASRETKQDMDRYPAGDEMVLVDEEGFAPLPDFVHHVDYLQWYSDYALDQTGDNAFDAYSQFMPGSLASDSPESNWPEFHNMFTDQDYDDSPAPWAPEDRPNWERSFQETQYLLELFREATQHEGYASPPVTSTGEDDGWSDASGLLMSIMLPSLSSHRTLSKATLAGAWRKEGGRVSPDRMTDAWRTALRNANHMRLGATLIEELVGMAESALVHKNARAALKHKVFSSAGEIAGALATLAELDHDLRDPMLSIRGEHAMSLDTVQYLFTPTTSDGKPAPNGKRLDAVLGLFNGSNESRDRIMRATAEDAYQAVETLDSYYRELGELMRIGYPEVRAKDVDAVRTRRVGTDNPMKEWLPSLGRFYKLRARYEASRRATKLTYATHLFHAHEGRWPSSLAELPAEPGETMRIDPFTGNYFGYRVDQDGPRIYSLSENGTDDGGVHSRRWDDRITNDRGSDDYVFWPPQE